MEKHRDVQSSRLGAEQVQSNFCTDMHPPLNARTATIEANRCYFCFDAPCIEACPTDIDVPAFIRMIQTGNPKGAGVRILEENILGGTCGRVCPVESLCQEACVRNTAEDKPVEIGLLQRYATDWVIEKGIHPFSREKSSSFSVAVIGAGPAGLQCAHRLAKLGHKVTIYEAKEKAGGLNEYGLAPYKVVNEFVQKEIKFILDLGGIEIQYGKKLGTNLTLKELQLAHSAVFISVGLTGVNALGVPGEGLNGVEDAVNTIAKIRQTKNLSSVKVGRRVVVVGGGSTAVDIAVEMKRLGAEFVTLVYRRGTERMKATSVEQVFAQKNGVLIKHWAKPIAVLALESDSGAVRGVEFEYTQDNGGKLEGTGEKFVIEADTVFKAIGQKLIADELGEEFKNLEVASGRVVVNEQFQTSIPGVYAGGDCINAGALTVNAVQDGKLAAKSIHSVLKKGKV